MPISNKKCTELYKDISDPIMDLRIEINGGSSIEDTDEKLFKLQNEIWEKVKKTLNIK